MLMAQQGVLLGFDGVGAKVGFRSASLQKMAQERVPNLEKAFETLFKRSIRVSLEIVTPEEAPVTAVKEPPPPPPAPPVRRSQAAPPAQPPSNQQPQNQSQNNPPKAPDTNGFSSNGAPNYNAPSSNNFSTNSPPVTPSQSNPSNNGKPSSRLDAPTDSVGFDQDQEKIKRFANFFNGQIVSLDEDGNANGESGNSSQQKSSDPGPDVPF